MMVFPVKFDYENAVRKFMSLDDVALPLDVPKGISVYSDDIRIRTALLSVELEWIPDFKHLLSNQKRAHTTSIAFQFVL